MAIAKGVVVAISPDVLIVQEVRDWKAMTELVADVEDLKVDMVSSFPLESPYQVAAIELGIASTFVCDSAWFARWTRDAENHGPPRGYAFAALEMSEGQFLLVYSLHLKANGRGSLERSIEQREESAAQLIKHVEQMCQIYGKRGQVAVIVGGDMNTNPDDPTFKDERTFKALKDAGFSWCWEGVPSEKRITIPGSEGFPDNCFDHIFYRGLKLTEVAVLDKKDASDHHPVEVTFDLSESEEH